MELWVVCKPGHFDEDPDPHSNEMPDPDPHSSEKLDQDPQ
jgi:hypothetical protein